MLSLNTLLLAAASLTTLASASPVVEERSSSNKLCKSLRIPLKITSSQYLFDLPFSIEDNFDAAAFAFANARRDAVTPVPTGRKNITATYTIDAKFCTPAKKTKKSDIVQVLTHGIGFDKQYWDFPLHASNYSYVAAAIDEGYSVFYYDRLANGLSTRPADALTYVQAPTELEILHSLSTLLRTNSASLELPGSVKPRKLVHVGHSFGSILSASLAKVYPADSDGIILTGFAHNTSSLAASLVTWGYRQAYDNQPDRFGDIKGKAYLTWADQWSQQTFYLSAPGDSFDHAVLKKSEELKQPAALGVMLTIGLSFGDLFKEIAFAKPVQVITGLYDLPFCGGNCEGLLDASSKFFTGAVKKGVFETVLHPGSGHSINMQYNATGAFQATFDFLGRSGL